MTERKAQFFEEPKMDFVRFDAPDIITTSDGGTIELPPQTLPNLDA